MNEEKRHRRSTNLVGPTILIGLGIILLLNNFGRLDWNWFDILRLWPLLIIAAGLEVLIGKRSLVGSFIAALVVLVLFVGSVWMLGVYPDNSVTGEVLTISEPRNDIESARIILSPAVAKLEVDSLRDSANFVEGNIEVGRREKINQRLTSGSHPRFTVETHSEFRPIAINTGPSRLWDLQFHPDVALNLQADMGVGDVDLNLRQLTIHDVDVNFGVGQVTLILPETGKFDVALDGGIGAVTIKVPEGMEVRVRADTAIVTRSVPDSYAQNDNVFKSPDYSNSAENHADITVDLGIGSVTVEEYFGE